MDMVESVPLPQHPGGLDGVAAHPEQVGGVQIHAHHGANGLPQTEQGLRVVHQLHPVVFQRDLTDAAVLRHADQFPPLGDGHLVPLVVQNVLGLWRPTGGDPNGGLVAGTAGGQAAHHHDLLHAQQLRQTEGFLRHLPVLLEGKGVAGTVQGAQGDIPATKLVHPALPGRFGAKQFVQVDVGRAGPVAGANLHGLNALRHAEIQHGRKGHIQCAGFDRKPHRGPPWSLIFLGAAAGRRMKIVFFRGELRGAIPW